MKLPSQDKRFESLSGIVLIPSYIMFKYKKYNKSINNDTSIVNNYRDNNCFIFKKN